MKKQRITLTKCKRCGTQIAISMSHPLGQICARCITPEEKDRILQEQLGVMRKSSKRNPEVKTHYLPQYKPSATGGIITGYRVWAYIGHPLLGEIPGTDIIVETKSQAQKVAAKMRKFYNSRNPIREGSKRNPESLYESFHGVSPTRKTKVYYEPPPSELIAIGELKQLNYQPRVGKRNRTEYYHRGGDLGDKTIKVNAVLATDKEGKYLYIVKRNKGKYPIFTERGILG